MSTYGELVNGLIEQRVKKINTLALGKLTRVDLATWKANVLLKSKIQDVIVELQEVPIAVQNFAAGSIHIAPAIGDVVIVGFAKHEVQALLGDKEVQEVNERILHNLNHALIIGGVHTDVDVIPAVASNEIVITHKSGTYFKFCSNGDIETNAPHLRFV